MSIDIFSILGGQPQGNSQLPSRDPGAVSGSAFVQNNMNLSGAEREANILNELIHGNVPTFLMQFAPIVVSNGAYTITYMVSPDYICIGNNNDYVRMPMNPLNAQKVADRFDCSLPTRKMVNDIYRQSINKITPLPWGPPFDADMEATHRIGTHNARIQAQLAGKNPFALTSGHKKDVVLTNKLYPNNPLKRVSIYGWIQMNGVAIQDLNPVSHDDHYADYSHGIRLVANDVVVNGTPMRIQDVWKNPTLAGLLSDEGLLFFQRY